MNQFTKTEFYKLIVTTDHKKLGQAYIIIGLGCGFIGFMLSLLIRLQLAGFQIFYSYQTYNVFVTIHAVLMVFFFIMPVLISGFGNIMIPLLQSVSDVFFPKANNFSFWLLPTALTLALGAFTLDGVGTGWTVYAPLSTLDPAQHQIVFAILALHVTGISSMLGALNFVATILYGWLHKDIEDIDLFTFTLLITAVLLIFSLPVLAVAITLVLADRYLESSFFNALGGGDPVLYIHIFWVFGHPEVYIIILPAFGIITKSIMLNKGQTGVFGHFGIFSATYIIAITGALVWAHHMYTTGLDIDTLAYFTGATLCIAVPTGVKIFSWVSSLLTSTHYSSISILFVKGFLVLFTLGGITGVILANAAVDTLLHDTYFVVGHFHLVMAIGAVLAVFVGLFEFKFTLWSNPFDIPGLDISNNVNSFTYETLVHDTKFALDLENTARGQFWNFFTGVLQIFGPLHYLGLAGLPRRYPVASLEFLHLNRQATGGLNNIALALFLFLNIIHVMNNPRVNTTSTF